MTGNDIETSKSLIAAARAAATAAFPPALAPTLAVLRAELTAADHDSHYQSFSAGAQAVQTELLAAGDTAYAAAHALLMIDAIDDFEERMPAGGYPASIRARFDRSYARILGKIAAADWAGYDRPGDLLWKDLGLAWQRLVPGGARVIEPAAHLPRSLLWRGGIGQGLRAVRLLAGGTGPYLKLHTHAYELDEFNAEGWEALMRRLADLLRQRPGHKGVFVGGWLYDPQLPAVTPRLGFHRALTIPNGAETYFYQRDGADSYAFAKSESRRRLFEEGKYTPEQHILVWRRAPLLAWADAQPS